MQAVPAATQEVAAEMQEVAAETQEVASCFFQLARKSHHRLQPAAGACLVLVYSIFFLTSVCVEIGWQFQCM